MKRQKSYKDTTKALYIVPTPIGNLEDITYRALKTLQEVDLIAAEDTRQTRKLLTHFDIHTPLFSYHEHNKQKAGEKLITEVQNGKSIALVSDAGMPAISDPGYDLVTSMLDQGLTVIPLPGANAGITALVASGLSTERFTFYGFLQKKKKDKKQELEALMYHKETLIFYESPYRLKETLEVMLQTLGDRKITVARELSKIHEEFIRGNISEITTIYETEEVKGECCIIVEGSNLHIEVDNWWEELSIEEHINNYINELNVHPNEAIKKTAKDRGLAKREVYEMYHR